MPRIARSAQPLYQTRGRPISWPIRMTNPGGSAMDLTGASAVCILHSAGRDRPLTIAISGPEGRILATGPTSLTTDMQTGQVHELQLTLTDSQGVITDYVWPVIGETP